MTARLADSQENTFEIGVHHLVIFLDAGFGQYPATAHPSIGHYAIDLAEVIHGLGKGALHGILIGHIHRNSERFGARILNFIGPMPRGDRRAARQPQHWLPDARRAGRSARPDPMMHR